MADQVEVPFRYYPHLSQERFHRDPNRYRLVSAGTGSGKTMAGIFEDLYWLLEYPGIVGYIFEPTYPMVRRILIPTLEHEIFLGRPLDSNPIISNFNRSENRIDLLNGSRLWFGSLEEPENAEGPNIDFVHVDEGRLVRKFDVAWQVILRRLRGSRGKRYPQGAWVTTTPDYPGSSLFNFFENPKTRNPNAKVFRWSIYDNPHLTPEFRREIERSHSGKTAERFIYGRFAEVSVGSLPFDSTIHVIDFIDKKFSRMVYGVDFGWTNPTAIVAVAYDNDDRAYVVDEYYQSQTHTETLIEELRLMMNKWGRGPVACDPTEPATIDKLNTAGLDAEGNRSKREEGIREIGGRLRKSGDNHPRLHVYGSCVNLTQELQTFDEKVKANDHAVDALRYALMMDYTPATYWSRRG